MKLRFLIIISAAVLMTACVTISRPVFGSGERIVLKNGIIVSVESSGKMPDNGELVAQLTGKLKGYEAVDGRIEFSAPSILDGIKRGSKASDNSLAVKEKKLFFKIIENLDIYVAVKDPDKGVVKQGIGDYGMILDVSIPPSVMARMGIRNNQILFFYNDNDETWYPMTDPKSGVISYSRDEKNGLGFRINYWPVDDKMLCSGP